jgi:biopolymer transport protein ExbB/TolQ
LETNDWLPDDSTSAAAVAWNVSLDFVSDEESYWERSQRKEDPMEKDDLSELHSSEEKERKSKQRKAMKSSVRFLATVTAAGPL